MLIMGKGSRKRLRTYVNYIPRRPAIRQCQEPPSTAMITPFFYWLNFPKYGSQGSTDSFNGYPDLALAFSVAFSNCEARGFAAWVTDVCVFLFKLFYLPYDTNWR